MRNEINIAIQARDDGSFVGLIPKNENLRTLLQAKSFEILTTDPEHDIVYLKEYSDEEQLNRADGVVGFHQGYSIEAFYEFLKECNENPSYPYIFKQDPSKLPNLDFFTEEQKKAYHAFTKKIEQPLSHPPSNQTTLSQNNKTVIAFFGGVSSTAGAWTMTQLIAPEAITSIMKSCFFSLITANSWLAMLIVAATIGLITALVARKLCSEPQLNI